MQCSKIGWQTKSTFYLKIKALELKGTFDHFQAQNVMSAQEIAESKLVFTVLDKNSDGKVSVCDIRTTMHKLGHDVSNEDCQDFIKKVSCNGNASFNEKDFLAWMETYREKDSETVLFDSFKAFDKDKNGLISRQELQEGLELMGVHLTEDMLDGMFSVADRNRDGGISFEEFVRVMKPS
ncbi:calmodulin isoform X1 [Lingula anatina]|uniref:Calmodulin isoform X1 n=1 Tax=Lingula anatina TaxID=7574 RepID=A0A1S3I6M4_LINAN|nr:calmodulin isoform X1 [Lingula anatina]|eukprot:XP_013393907.1 calmodulin isoform X1 [Lingula anatina]